MEENRFNQTLRDKFQDLESPFNDRVTFEAVMKKREKKKRRVIFWLPSVAVVAGLFLSAGMGYMLLSDSKSAVKLPQVALKNVVVKPNKKSFVKEQKKKSEALQGAGISSVDISSNQRGVLQSKSLVGQSQIRTINSLVGDLINTDQTLLTTPVKIVEEGAAAKMVEMIQNAESQLMFCNPRGIYPVSIGMSQMKEEFIEIPEGEYEKAWDPGRYRSKWYGELGASTGSKVIVDFDNKNELSVLGTMYHANYQGLILRDMGNGIMLGTGISYGEWIGNGEWQLTQTERKTLIDSYDLVVMIPPVQTVRVYDTTEVIDTKVTTGEIHYKIDKVSLPLAMRYNLMLGKVAWRLAAQVNPGITTKTTGDYFTKTEYHPILEQRMLCMDAKLAFGPSFALTTAWTLVLEPNAMLHSFYDKSGKRTYSKVLTGFGMTVVRKF
ncbi:MAG: hypothetical protein EXR23_00360 [Flavobacteriaceae bacterium]|nr:hypothetical protein [Flavobacteriaceae bacterium]PHX77996.1 MAG: hypothetical protein CK543_00335 [Flavobacteriales bacterium]